MLATRQYIEALITALSTEKTITFKEGKTWQTDVTKKIITYDMADLLKLDYLSAKGLILHELSHLNYTTDTPETDLQKKFSDMQGLYNAFEDIRIEHKAINHYGDFAKQAFESTYADFSEINAKELQNPTISLLHKMLSYVIGYNAYQEYTLSYENNRLIKKNLEILLHILPLEEQAIAGTLSQGNYKIHALTDTKSLKEYVDREIYPLLEKYITNNPHTNQEITGLHNKGHLPNMSANHDKTPVSFPSYNEAKHLLTSYTNTLSRKLESILKEKTANKFEGNHRTGRLLSRNAYKVVTGEEKLFSKKNNPRKPKYTITVILDASGSMKNKKSIHTYITAVLLEEIAKKLRFTYNLFMYNENPTKITDLDDYTHDIGGGNNDQKALQAVNKIINPTDDNLVFMLTDGEICSQPQEVENELKQLRAKNCIVTAVGVGLSSTEHLKTYYKQTVSAPNTQELPNLLIRQLQKYIHR